MVPNVPARVSTATTAASTASSAISAAMRSCRRRPLAARAPDLAADGAACVASGSALRPKKGSLEVTSSLNAMCFPLSQELAFATDDRQVDEFRSGMALGRIADEESAQVHVVHLLHRVDEAFARQVAAGTAQALDHHLGGEVTLHRAEVVVAEARFLRRRLVLLHHRHRGAPRERHHLRDGDAAALLAERRSERGAADEGNVVEG